MLKKLITLIMSIFLIICAGTCNYYPLYLSNIMTKYAYSTHQAYLFASFIHLGYWFLFPLGFIYDRFGPGISLIIACVCLPGSYTILNIMIMMVKTKIHIAPMVILGFIMGQGSALCFLVSITTNLYNFNENANLISGILITNQAITPSLFTSYEKTMNDKTESDDYEFIIFIGLILATIIAVGAWLVQVESPIKKVETQKHNQSITAIGLDIDKEKEDNIKKFNVYKENKVCMIFGVLNVFTLFLFVFGMIYNNKTSKSKLPIMYFLPVLQVVNVVLIILEKCKVWDNIMMKYFYKCNSSMKENSNESKERKDNNSSLGNEEMSSKKKEDDKNIAVDVDSEKSIIEKKMNLSFNYQKRINDLKVKYEIDPIQHQLNDNNNNNVDILNQIFGEHHNENKNENIGSSNNFNNNIVNNYPLITDFISNNSNNKEILYNNVINANQNDFLDVDRVFSSTNPQGEEVKSVQHHPQIEQNNIISDNLSEIQIPKIEKREGYIETIPKNQPKTPLCKILFTQDIIMMFCLILLATGAASSLNNNIDSVLKSIKLNIKPSKINDFSIIYFAFDSFFRMVCGIILNWIFAKQHTNIFLLTCVLLGLISQLISIKMTQGVLYANIILSGIINGSLITFIGAFVKDYNQKKHYGKILGMLYSAVGIGKLLISDFIFPAFTERFRNNEETCQGYKCFMYSFLMNGFFYLVMVLYIFVRIVVNKRRKMKEKKEQSEQSQKNENSTS